MKTFTLLWSSILDSTLWIGTDVNTRIVWITLLALKDSRGEVHNNPVGLARRAVLSLEDTLKALEVLSSPDPLSGHKAEEGRRIVPLEGGGGWRIVSHDYYRMSDDRREYWRTQKQKSRAKKNLKLPQGMASAESREDRYVKAVESGDLKKADKIAAEGLK